MNWTKTALLCFFIAIKFILTYGLVSPEYDLHRDEYLHLDQAHHLAWGYLSVPPATSWVSVLIYWLGNGVFWVRFFPALFGVLTLVLVWQTIEVLNGSLFALVLGAIAITCSVITRINVLYQPNSLDILCWTAVYFCLANYIKTKRNNWLIYMAVCFAIGFLNKYNIVFLALGLLPALLVTEHRQVLINRWFYIAAVVALLLISPNLIWQVQQGWPVFHHLKQLSTYQLVNVNRSDFLKEQVVFFLGSLFVLLAAFVSFFTYRPHQPYRVFFWAYVFTIVMFVYFKAKGYYAIGAYPILLAFGAVYVAQLLQAGAWRYLRPVAIVIIALLFVPMARVAFPVMSPARIAQEAPLFKSFNLLRWEDGHDHTLPQDFADMLGWHELAQKVDTAYEQLGDPMHTLVLCDNYGQAGAINYYSRHTGIGAVSLNADYINWFPLNRSIRHVILVQESTDDDPNRNEEKPLFEKISLGGRIENPFARERGTSIYILKGAKISINDRLKNDIAQEKARE